MSGNQYIIMTATLTAQKNITGTMPNFDIVKPFFTKLRSFLSKLFPRRTKVTESFDSYLKVAENIKQRIHQENLQSKIVAFNGSFFN